MEKEIERQIAQTPPTEAEMGQDFLQTTDSFDLGGTELENAPPGSMEFLDTGSADSTDMFSDTSMEANVDVSEGDTDLQAFAHPPIRIPPRLLAPVIFNFTVEGMETTQAIQFYKSSRTLHAPHSEPDNVVPLIRSKALGIRVYPHLFNTRYSSNNVVRGDVWYKRIDIPGQPYRKAVVLNGATAGRRSNTIDRGDKNQTLNFRIPAYYARGRLLVYTRCRVYAGGAWRNTPWLNRTLTFTSVPRLRVRAHGVHYHRNGILKTAPPLSDFIATSAYMRKTYPISGINFVSYGVIHFSGNLQDTSAPGCGTGWNALMGLLWTKYIAAPDAVHYALMKTGIPTGYTGCGGGSGRRGASFVGGGSTMAQEIGHSFGRAHAPGAPGADTSYPWYTHPKTASIGEFGMDTSTGAIYKPSNSNDFMGYSGNRWVSPYTYRGLMTDIASLPAPSANAAGAEGVENADVEMAYMGEDLRIEQEHLYLSFKVDCNGRVDLQGGFTLVGPANKSSGEPTDHSMELHDGQGNVLWAKRLVLEGAHQSHDDSHTEYAESIPMMEGAAKLLFKCGHTDGATVIDIPKKAPTVSIKAFKVDTCEAQSGTVPLKWSTQVSKGEQVTSILRFTNDDGKTWLPFAVLENESEYVVDLDQLPGGKECRVQVMASTMLRTATAETETFAVAKTSAQAMISPVSQDEATKQSGVVELAGCAYSPDGCANEDDVRWNSSLDGDLGCGEILIANNLTPGEHVISLTAPDGLGGTTRAEYRVQVPATQC